MITGIFEKNLKQLNGLVAADMVKRYPVELAETLEKTVSDIAAGFRKERMDLKGNSVELKHMKERELVYVPLFNALKTMRRNPSDVAFKTK